MFWFSEYFSHDKYCSLNSRNEFTESLPFRKFVLISKHKRHLLKAFQMRNSLFIWTYRICHQRKNGCVQSSFLCVIWVWVTFTTTTASFRLSNAVLQYEQSAKTPTMLIFWCTQTHERRLMSEKSLTIKNWRGVFYRSRNTKIHEVHNIVSISHGIIVKIKRFTNTSELRRPKKFYWEEWVRPFRERIFHCGDNCGAAEAVKISSWTTQWFVWNYCHRN